jgi:kynurenine formamidase
MREVVVTLVVGALLAGSPAAQQTDSVQSVLSARVIELNHVWDKSAPVHPLNPPFSMGLHTSHRELAGTIPGGVAFNMDLMFFSGQHGAPTIDAIGHVSSNGKLYGGADAAASEGTDGLTTLGIETYPKEKFVNRGVLFDVARHKRIDVLEPGYEITSADLEATARAEGVGIRRGDSVLIRTGFGWYFEKDREKYTGLRPGLGEEAAKWLVEKGIFLAGSDQLSFQVEPQGGTVFPVHRMLVAENGIYIVENMNLEELARTCESEGAYEFVLVLNPLRIKGATASPLNAFALMP